MLHANGLSELASTATRCLSADEFRSEAIAWIDRAVGIDAAFLVQLNGPQAKVTTALNFDPGVIDRLHRNIGTYANEIRAHMEAALRMDGAYSGEMSRLERWAALPHSEGLIEDFAFPLGIRIGTPVVATFRSKPLAVFFLGRSGRQRLLTPEQGCLLSTAAPILALGMALQERGAPALPKDPPPHLRGAPRAALTPRERSVVEYAVLGLTCREIGLALGTSVNTVRNQLAAIFEKLSVASRAEMVAVALTEGLVDASRPGSK
jgi:DNA-binding CsgD family transcriptional regulator